jgi:hypothetical protein
MVIHFYKVTVLWWSPIFNTWKSKEYIICTLFL